MYEETLKVKIYKKPKKVSDKNVVYELFRCDGKLRKRRVKTKFNCHDNAEGYRLMHLNSLQTLIKDISVHSSMCAVGIEMSKNGESPIQLVSEINTYGLASVLSAKCIGCKQNFVFCTSPKLSNSLKRFDVNVRAVWGTIVTGNGLSHLNELFAVLDSPGMSHSTFSGIEKKINKWWEVVLETDLNEAIEEEKRLAVECGSFHDGKKNLILFFFFT